MQPGNPKPKAQETFQENINIPNMCVYVFDAITVTFEDKSGNNCKTLIIDK